MKSRQRVSKAPLPPANLELVGPSRAGMAGFQAAVLATELPPSCAVAVVRGYRLVTNWAAGPDGWPAPGQTTLLGWEDRVSRSPDHELLIWAPLATIASELRNPAAADRRWIALACTILSGWAAAIGARKTAALLAEAAALACPTDPQFAWAAGKALAGQNIPWCAEHWFSRASRIAIWNKDWDTHAAALGSLAQLARVDGRFQDAEKLLTTALRVAKRENLREREGKFCVDLLTLAAHSNDVRKAETHARSALQACAPADDALVDLARGIANLWYKHGRFASALQVYRALLPHVSEATERLQIASACARAAGAVSDEATFHVASRTAWTLLDAGIAETEHPTATFALATGAIDLALWDDARHALAAALHGATLAGDEVLVARIRSAQQPIGNNQTASRTPDLRNATRSPDRSLAGEIARKLDRRVHIPAAGQADEPIGDSGPGT